MRYSIEVRFYSPAKTIAKLSTLPKNCTEIALTLTDYSWDNSSVCWHLSKHGYVSKAAFLQSLVKSCPSHVHTLDLDRLFLVYMQAPELVNILKSIPPSVRTLHINHFIPEDLISKSPEILSQIPGTVERVHIDYSQLKNCSIDIKVAALKALPKGIKHLSLHYFFVKKSNHSYIISPDNAEDFIKILNAFGEHVVELDLSSNSLSLLPTEVLCKILANLPPSIKVLILKDNQLGGKKASDVAMILASISKHVNEVDLQSNFNFSVKCSNNYSTDDWVEIIQALPRHIVKVNFANNLFCINQSSRHIERVFGAFSPHLTSLDISIYNDLITKEDVLDAFFCFLPKNLKHLHIEHSSMGLINILVFNQIITALKCLSPKITSLKLSIFGGMQFYMDINSVAKVIEAIPQTVRSIEMVDALSNIEANIFVSEPRKQVLKSLVPYNQPFGRITNLVELCNSDEELAIVTPEAQPSAIRKNVRFFNEIIPAIVVTTPDVDIGVKSFD